MFSLSALFLSPGGCVLTLPIGATGWPATLGADGVALPPAFSSRVSGETAPPEAMLEEEEEEEEEEELACPLWADQFVIRRSRFCKVFVTSRICW